MTGSFIFGGVKKTNAFTIHCMVVHMQSVVAVFVLLLIALDVFATICG